MAVLPPAPQRTVALTTGLHQRESLLTPDLLRSQVCRTADEVMAVIKKEAAMKRHVLLIVTLLSFACGNEPTSPSLPSSTVRPSPDPAFMMRGEVRDTTNLPIAGAQVQAVGPSGGTGAVTDANGEFDLPWPFLGTATVRVSKEGFSARARPVPEPGSLRRPEFLRFDLEAIDRPVVIAGMYQMTLSAANECTQLPNVARQRTYAARVFPTEKVGSFTVGLVGGDFPYSSVFTSEVHGDSLHTLRVHVVTELDWGNPVTSVVERINPDMLLEFTGSADLAIGAHSTTAAFDGTFTVCAAEAALADRTPYRCPIQPVTCRSANHRVAWTRQ